jgi:uncharacterized protein YqjF (DUF2071 family)
MRLPQGQLSRTAHRPWPPPDRPWRWRQSWRDLLFAHWPVPARALRGLVPEPLRIQEFDGTSWVGIVPFRMQGVMLRPLPDLPGVSAFPELNARLYVEHEDRPGVWFVSLDAASRLAVITARRLFHLPYHHARMRCVARDEHVEYLSERRGAAVRTAFRGAYGPVSLAEEARHGTLEHFLTERYCLYTADTRGRILRAEVHHAPWPLQRAEAEIEENSMGAAQGLPVEGAASLLHFSRRLDVVVWGTSRLT